MRLLSIKVITVCLLSVLSAMHARGNNEGLYFNSHSYTTTKRTTLLLNDGNPIEVKDPFRMSFYMDLRGGESLFGNIFCIKTNDGKHIDATLSMPSEGVNKPVLVVDGKLHYIDYNIEAGKDIKVEITLDKKNGNIAYDFGGHKITVQADLEQTKTATILFGMHRDDGNYVDVAPMNVRDIIIAYGKKTAYSWNLKQHWNDVCLDNISDAPATATNGHWTLDNHVEWETVLTYKSGDKVQVTYNQKDDIFYIVDNKTVRCFDPETQKTKTVSVKGGHRAMMYSNYIAYDTSRLGLYTFNMKDKLISRFDFSTGRWNNDRQIPDEPGGFNHAWATANDSIAYTFGGYGFYRYKNCLWRINTRSGEMSQIDYTPALEPRTGAAMAVVGNKLYIFGGYGNTTGEQELPCSYYYDLSCIDLTTMKAETLWTVEGEQQNTSFMLTAEMLYNSDDCTFYAATTNRNGRLIKISMKEPGWKIVTEGMNGDFSYKDMTFNLYKSDKNGKIYVVINRRMNNLEHNIRICSIDLPIQDDYITKEELKKAADESGLSWWLLLLLVIPAGAAAYYIRSRRCRKATPRPDTTMDAANGHSEKEKVTEPIETPIAQVSQPTPPSTDSQADDDYNEEEEKKEETVKYYTHTGGYISLLGKFVVHDRNGEDITSLFTRRTRNLLLMLLLHSARSSKGIEIHVLDEALWQEMNEEAARNNRNVYMRKLRMLLEKIGKVEVINDKIHYRMELGDDVFFDYQEALDMMNRMEEDDNEEITARTLELLFEGPLLPNYSFEWLDKFKADYSNAVISLLTRQLRREQQNGNDNMALKIAETIMMHDPFSDNALATQCSILCRRHKKGIAKNVYDNFCKNYETSIGEKYYLSFAEVCK